MLSGLWRSGRKLQVSCLICRDVVRILLSASSGVAIEASVGADRPYKDYRIAFSFTTQIRTRSFDHGPQRRPQLPAHWNIMCGCKGICTESNKFGTVFATGTPLAGLHRKRPNRSASGGVVRLAEPAGRWPSAAKTARMPHFLMPARETTCSILPERVARCDQAARCRAR